MPAHLAGYGTLPAAVQVPPGFVLSSDGAIDIKAGTDGSGNLDLYAANTRFMSGQGSYMSLLSSTMDITGHATFSAKKSHAKEATITLVAGPLTTNLVYSGVMQPITSAGAFTFAPSSGEAITGGTDGALLCLVNVGTFTITFQDESLTPASNLHLGGANYALAAKTAMWLVFDSNTGCWVRVKGN